MIDMNFRPYRGQLTPSNVLMVKSTPIAVKF
jgi:hypothetical protein